VETSGRLVLVTGASSGIGAATVRLAASRGARILALARSADRLEALAEEVCAAGGDVWSYAVDCGSRAKVAAAAGRIVAEHGVPDVLVNNAGAGRYLFLDQTAPEELDQMLAAPLQAALYVTRAFLPAMVERGSGRVVTVNAPIAYVPWPGAAGYGVARWGVRGLHEMLRADLRGTGVGASQVVPGLVSSGYFTHNPGVEESLPPISRFFPTLTPEQVAAAIVRAWEREREYVFLPQRLRLMVSAARLFPRIGERVARAGSRPRTLVDRDPE
jgi:NADP-dependent 3-hydroxy acid dehydrogenase YdfG